MNPPAPESPPSPPKKRAWFQFHLSTCILVMVTAAAIAYLNTRPREHVTITITPPEDSYPSYYMAVRYQVRYGWPFEMAEYNQPEKDQEIFKAVMGREPPSLEGFRKGLAISLETEPWVKEALYPQDVSYMLEGLPRPKDISINQWDRLGILLNLIVLLGCILLFAVPFEWFFRHRTSRTNNLPNSTSE